MADSDNVLFKMADLARVSIDKLNNDNYQSWKYEAELILRRENTWFSVTTPQPAAGHANLSAWQTADSKAMGTIGLLIEKSQHVHTRPATSAKEAWESLKEHHEKASLSSTVHMYVKLANMKLSEDGDVERLMHEIDLIVTKLIAVGEPVSDRFQVGMMLGNLPGSYATLITALECRAEADLTVGMVREKVLSEYKRRKEGSDVTSVKPKQESAMKVQDTGDKAKSKTKATCHFCHKPGHFKAKCWKYKAFKKSQSTEESPQVAKIATKTTSSNGNHDTPNDTGQFCFVAKLANNCESVFNTQAGTTDNWYVDSAATCHMTNSGEFFESFDANVCESVRIADGSVTKSKGVGNLRLQCMKPAGGVNDVLVQNVRYVPELDANLLSVRTLTKMGMDVNFS